MIVDVQLVPEGISISSELMQQSAGDFWRLVLSQAKTWLLALEFLQARVRRTG